MAIKVDVVGDRELPLLVCVHGLLGGPGDFMNLRDAWAGKFCLVLVDMNAEFREGGLMKVTREGFGRLTYDDAADDVFEYLNREFPARSAYFVGISIGGKVVYDFSYAHPDLFMGAVISDVGLGQIPESDLYTFIEVTIPSINLNLEWDALKQEVASKVHERNTRVIIQTQLFYPDGKPPAQWKPGMEGLRGMLSGARIKEQWYVLDRLQKKIIVLRAGFLSGIPAKDIPRMTAHPCIEVRQVNGSAHFVHIQNKEVFQSTVLELLPASGT